MKSELSDEADLLRHPLETAVVVLATRILFEAAIARSRVSHIWSHIQASGDDHYRPEESA
jgi:hypothetical protein